MNPAFWLALTFYLIAAGWTLLRAWPTMKRMLALTEQAAAAAERSSLLFADILKELRKVDVARVEKLLEAVEKWAKPKPPAAPSPLEPDRPVGRYPIGEFGGSVPDSGKSLGDGTAELPPPPPFIQ